MSVYRFRPVTAADLPLVAGWHQTPDVRRWWIDADGSPSPPIGEADLAEDAANPGSVRRWLVSHATEHGGAPFAYIQDYDPHHVWADPGAETAAAPAPAHHFAHLPPGSRGIDQFIGVPEMLGRGHGSAFIAAHCAQLAADGCPAVGTDPHPANARAIRAYEKAGFVRTVVAETAWGRAQLMELGARRGSSDFGFT